MASTYVRCIPGDEKMQITVEYCHEGSTSRAYNLDRKQFEEVGTALNRLKTNLAKSLFKKKKKKKNVPANSSAGEDREEDAENNLNVLIINTNGRKVDETVPNNTAWIEGNRLRIGNTDIPISVNAPTVKLLPLPSSIMAGFPVFPRFELEFADLQNSVFTWERLESSPKEEVLGAEGGDSNSDNSAVSHKCFDQIYTPTTADIDFRLKLTCVPGRNGQVGREDFVVSDDVKPGPGVCPFETRHLFTPTRTEPDGFRVVSYNLLADIYSDSEFAREVLFPHCPPYALDMDYRRQLLLKEITGYNADIICLQEVDRKVFENELLPSLDLLGYTGSLKVKGQQGCEGVAIFIHRDKFRIVSQEDVSLTEMMLSDPACSDLRASVEKLPKLQAKMDERSTVLQTMVVESLQQRGKYLCLANTHLYFHPAASHVRLLQGATSVRHIEAVCRPYIQQGKSIAVVFCGDFNSSPSQGIVQLMTKKNVPQDYGDWSSGKENYQVNLALPLPSKYTKYSKPNNSHHLAIEEAKILFL
ncbi:hypothetical protein V1264_012910 [Littorina saxatilis]|uniref:2',5'-phosphodiesterase 12 n=1 Tax=Littorina saxatilis TaxID=31220 RepID=A0AAN9BY66_9CAEN